MSVEIAISRATGPPRMARESTARGANPRRASRPRASRLSWAAIYLPGTGPGASGEAELITDGGPAAIAAKKATAAVPIVIGAATSKFLERQRLIASLARLGGKHHGLYHLHSPSPEFAADSRHRRIVKFDGIPGEAPTSGQVGRHS